MIDHNQIANKTITFEKAFDFIKSDSHIVTSMAAAEPKMFFENLAEVARKKENIAVYCANPSKEYLCFADDELKGHLKLYLMFITSPVRKHQGRDFVHYVPQHLSRWATNLREAGVDIFWGTCTPPDARGFVSLGTGACYEPEVLRYAKKVILEVNPQVPQTNGATQVPLTWIDHFVYSDYPLPTAGPSPTTAEDETIGDLVADLIADGSTLQLGIGSIPNAIGAALHNKRNLGIHTELINECMMNLYLKGVITGREKTIWPGKMVGAFVYGSRELYDFVHLNPVIDLQPASVVNDPYRIGRNHKMISVNTAVEVDLTGQVCSESIGHYELSGVGGAAETHIGAQLSREGRGIIALKSTCRDHEGRLHSKIVFELKGGAKVSISRNDIDTVVTEYGIARLRGKSVGERVRALAALAHPRYRDELLSNARKHRYI